MYWDKLNIIIGDLELKRKNIDNNFIRNFHEFLQYNTTEKERLRLNPIKVADEMCISEEVIMSFFKVAKKNKLFKPIFYYNCICGEQFKIEISNDNTHKIYTSTGVNECINECHINYEEDKGRIFVYFELLDDIEDIPEDIKESYTYQVDYMFDEYEGEYTNSLDDYEKVVGSMGVNELIDKDNKKIIKSIKIAQISDLHFGSSHSTKLDNKAGLSGVNSLEKTPFDSFKKIANKEKYDYLIISGDITTQGEVEGLEQFQRKMDELELNKQKTYIVPGNHECDRNEDRDKTQFSNFISYTSKYNTPFSREPYILDDENKVLIYGFNSIHYSKPDSKELFYINEEDFDTLENNLETIATEKSDFFSYTKVAVLHNNLLSHSTIEIKEYGEVLNLFKLKYKLIELGFSVVFSGHKHEEMVEKHIIYDRGKGKSIILVSAPSLCGSVKNGKNGFQVLKLSVDNKGLNELEIEKFELNKMEQFESVEEFKVTV